MKIIRIANNSIDNSVVKFVQKWESQGIGLSLHEGSNYLKLTEIVVPKGSRKEGIGTTIMNELVTLSNQLGKRVVLTPSISYGGSSLKRLKNFYKRFDFVDNKGGNKDFTTQETMYREPNREPNNENN